MTTSRADRSWGTLTGIILLWQVTASITFYAIYAIPPFVQADFDVGATQIGVMITALMLGYTLFLVPIGGIIDVYGESRVLVIGLVGLGVGVVGVALAPTFLVLLVVVFVVGTFYATAIPGTNKAVFAAIPAERLNTSMGIKQVGVTAGSGLSAIVIPWFGASRFGWEVGVVLLAVVALVVSVVFRVLYGPSEEVAGRDRGGIRSHFRTTEYTLLTAAGFFLGAALFTTMGYTILYVDQSVGAGVVFAGLALASAQLFGSIGRVVFGWLADRLSAPLTVSTLRILILQATAAALLFLVVTVVDTPLLALGLFGALGFFIFGFTGIYYSCIGSLVPTEEMGSATAGGQLALNFGALGAPAAFGWIVDGPGYGVAWPMLALCSLFALGLLVVIAVRVRQSAAAPGGSDREYASGQQ